MTYQFLKSALTEEGASNSTNELLSWLDEERKRVQYRVERIQFNQLKGWRFEENTGNLVHESGKFFSIIGLSVATNWGNVSRWSQPIINQPEIGILGVLAKEIDGVLCFLMQAKIEPGNINGVQISPTLQATKSNYTRIHKGNSPEYLNYFTEKSEQHKILLDQLQSEQGARFLRKRNRNIIVKVTNEVEVKPGFAWMTLGQIKKLMAYDNVVNMDTRTVLSGIPYGDLTTLSKLQKEMGTKLSENFLVSELDSNCGLHSIEDIISWITELKSSAELNVNEIPLNEVENWIKTDNSIHHLENKYFKVIAVESSIFNREVQTWTQPIIESAQEGIIAFIIKKINGVYHFLVQAKMELGNFDIIELAPTVQCLTGNYRKGKNEYEVPYLDTVLNHEENGGVIHYSTYQSEEGGRFYTEQNKNMIIEVGEEFGLEVNEKYMWMTLNQLKTFIKFNNYINIQARSLLAAINYKF